MHNSENFKAIHENMVKSSLQAIKSNIDQNSIFLLLPFVSQMVASPEFLAVVDQHRLLVIWDAINDELRFRTEERRA